MDNYIKKVSVIVPVYNSENNIKKCIESILNQTYSNIEAIFINDGSLDNSLNIINEYAEKESIIKVYTQNNAGASQARNNGISKATGDYILFCDSDDMMESTLIEKLVKADDDNYDVILSGYVRKTYEGKILQRRIIKEKPLSFYGNVAPWAKLFRRDYVIENDIKFPINLVIAEDAFFNIKAYHNSDKIKVVPIAEYYYMVNSNSITGSLNNNLKKIDDIIYTLDFLKKNISSGSKKELEYFYIKTAMFFMLTMCKKAKKEDLYQAYNNLFAWIESNTSYKNRYLSIFDNSGEDFKVKTAIVIFRLFQKLRIIKPMLYLYSKI